MLSFPCKTRQSYLRACSSDLTPGPKEFPSQTRKARRYPLGTVEAPPNWSPEVVLRRAPPPAPASAVSPQSEECHPLGRLNTLFWFLHWRSGREIPGCKRIEFHPAWILVAPDGKRLTLEYSFVTMLRGGFPLGFSTYIFPLLRSPPAWSPFSVIFLFRQRKHDQSTPCFLKLNESEG